MNEYDLQVMFLIAVGTGVCALFVVMEVCLQAYWAVQRFCRKQK